MHRLGFAQGAVQFDVQLDHVAGGVAAENFEMLWLSPRLPHDGEAVRFGRLKSGHRFCLFQLMRRVMRLPGMFDEDRSPPVYCDAVNLQLRRLHVAD
jgi:hypothetical protein